MKRLALVTSSRADFGFYAPLLRALGAHRGFETAIIATGMHLSPEFGLTVGQIEAAGFAVAERVESLVSSDRPEGLGKSMGMGMIGFAELFSRRPMDCLVVFGDRFDMYPAALAAAPFRIPIAHIGGGEVTEGAIDDGLRHSLTKLSHLHFVATSDAGERVIQLGEEPWRVTVCGALSLDGIRETGAPREELMRRYGVDAARPMALVTYHPVTLEYDRTEEQVRHLLAALEVSGLQCVFTFPNADTAGRQILRAIEQFCTGRADRHLVVSAGQRDYVGLMQTAAVMVGNSSSGLVEAPSFELPTVNIGTRQEGRLKPANVIDCGYRSEEIRSAIARATSIAFRESLRGLRNPYGDGHAAERIVAKLEAIEDFSALSRKKFVRSAAAHIMETAACR